MKSTTILITNTVSKEVKEKEFKSKKEANKWINRSNHYNAVNQMKNEYYQYKQNTNEKA